MMANMLARHLVGQVGQVGLVAGGQVGLVAGGRRRRVVLVGGVGGRRHRRRFM